MDVAKRVKSIKPSPTLAVSAKAKAMQAQGIDVIGFGAGEPDFDTPDNIKEAAIKAIREGFTKYTPAGGMEALKNAVCQKLKRENNLDYTSSQILISCGAKHSLYNIFQALLQEDDEVLIPSPYWVSYPDMVLLADATPVIVKATEKTNFKVSPDDLLRAITPKTKALILNSPSNPTGMAYTREELKDLAQIVLHKDIVVITDEIYEKIVYDDFTFFSIASLEPRIKDQTIVVNGVSKSFSMTGWRIGYAAGPQPIISAMASIQSQSTSNPTSIAQKASLEALTGPQDFIPVMVKEFDRRRKYMVERLNALPGVTCFKPTGAFYVFPNVTRLYGRKSGDYTIKDSTSFSQYLLKHVNVAVVPGIGFGSDDNVRLSYATSFETIAKGLDRMHKAIEELQ